MKVFNRYETREKWLIKRHDIVGKLAATNL